MRGPVGCCNRKAGAGTLEGRSDHGTATLNNETRDLDERTKPLLIPNLPPPATLVRHYRHHSPDGFQTATYYTRGDSNPHLADGSYYGDHGPLFCAAPSNVPLGSVLRLHNPRTGRTIRVVVRDRCRDHVDLSRGAFIRLGGRGGRVPIEARLERRGRNARETHHKPAHHPRCRG